MVERSQTDGEGQIAERICHMTEMLKWWWWFDECCRFFPAFIGKTRWDVNHGLYPLILKLFGDKVSKDADWQIMGSGPLTTE